MARDRRLGWLVVLAGAALAVAVQLVAPVGVPLYDGVVVAEPYRYLHPTGTEAGQPTSYTSDEQVAGGASPAFAAATTENPPQAQLIAQTGAFVLSPGATTLHVSITPVEPPAASPPNGAIAGNVYEVSVSDQSGTALAIAPCDGCLSLSMRAPQGTDTANLWRFAGGTWTQMDTLPVGVISMFQSNPTALGDVAVVTAGSGTPPGPGTPTPSGIDPVVIFGVGAVGLWLLVFGLIVWQRARPAPQPGVPARGQRGGIPSKQAPSKPRPPRRPGSGRQQP